ncbi:hypothetical protein F5884DRAFT_373546 [Xylogone sp. PMI_703]|nr:hypothetical protein F5884DRAFT_373546 [Xylogone sp. PMI_703]
MLWRQASICFLLTSISLFSCAAGAQTQNVTITGIHTGVNNKTGERPPRRNILDLQYDTPQWSLYILALAVMQTSADSDLLGYYQISGIHGRPYIAWNGVNTVPGAPSTGYCTHDSVLFPTWHRPYMALFEQILVTYAQQIAEMYPASFNDTYKTAAKNLRVPFWDWASNATIPSVVNQPSVVIQTPYGYQPFANPLYQYQFKSFPLNTTLFPPDAYDGELAQYKTTVRSPDKAGGPSNFATANSQLTRDNLKQRTYDALVKSTTFNTFATVTYGSNAIEGVHGSVHVDIGGTYGHMSQLSYSAFDPIFWLHHANVDRLFAIWEALYPDQFLESAKDIYGTFTIPTNSNDTIDTPLTPFSKDGTAFFTSTGVRSMSVFGYTYPEIQDWNQTPTQLKANVTSQINKLYNPNGVNTVSKRFMDGEPKLIRRPHAKATERVEKDRAWSVSIQVNKFGLDGTRFFIRVFLGAVPKDPNDWSSASTLAGSMPVLPAPHGMGPLPVVLVNGEVNLSQELAEAGFDGNEVDEILLYLKKNLHFKIQMVRNITPRSSHS